MGSRKTKCCTSRECAALSTLNHLRLRRYSIEQDIRTTGPMRSMQSRWMITSGGQAWATDDPSGAILDPKLVKQA